MTDSIVFDLDGTLVDLPVDIDSARAEIATLFAELGYHEPMRPILSAINRAAASVATRDDEIYPLIIRARRILDRAETIAAVNACVRPGVLDALEVLKGQGRKLGIVTDNSRACIPMALEVLNCRSLDFWVSTRDDVRRTKPAPDGLIRVASDIARAGETVWFIGDSPIDVSAAVAANPQVPATVRALAIPGPRSTEEQLRAAGPCIVCHDMAEAIRGIEEGNLG